MAELPPDLARVFAELTEQVGGIRPETLAPAYLAALKEIEDLPCNQSGQDKSWVLASVQRWLDTIKDSRFVGCAGNEHPR